MTAKEYLSQAYRIDQRILCKKKEIESLRGIAAGCSVSYTGMPRSPSPSRSPMEDAVLKVVMMEKELERELEELLGLKVEVMGLVCRLECGDYRLLLEKRYLCFESWEEIAAGLHCSVSWALKQHRKALEAVDAALAEREKEKEDSKVQYSPHKSILR